MSTFKLELPALEGSICHAFTVCGHVKTVRDDLLALLRGRQEMEFRYRDSGSLSFLHVVCGGQPVADHVHVDVASRAFFRKRKPPAPTHKKADAERLLANFSGEQIDSGITARLQIPRSLVREDGLRQLLEPSVIEESSGTKFTVRPTGMEVSAEGTPIRSIFFALDEPTDTLRATLKFDRSFVINGSYLSDALSSIMELTEDLFLESAKPKKKPRITATKK